MKAVKGKILGTNNLSLASMPGKVSRSSRKTCPNAENSEVIRDSLLDFTKGKSCLITLAVFCYGVTTSVDEGIATAVIYLNFCKAFDMIQRNILASTLESYGFIDGLLDG